MQTFTSPSSVEKEVKARQLGNTHIHGMTSVMVASIAYIAMQAQPLPESYQSNDWLVIWDRFASPYHHCPYFEGQTHWQTPSTFMILCWNSWMIQRRRMMSTICWCGGIGRHAISSHCCSHSDDFAGSQVFPSFVTHEFVVTKQSVLARLKGQRAEKQSWNLE